MLYKILKIERKSTSTGAELADVQVRDVAGVEFTATIWKLDKEGKTFPNFDGLNVGGDFEGNLWTNPSTGKSAIYPPKLSSTGKTGGGGAMSKAEDKKAEHIDAHQDKKDHAIRLSQSFEWAIQLAIAENKVDNQTIINWRKWIWETWENPIDPVPF